MKIRLIRPIGVMCSAGGASNNEVTDGAAVNSWCPVPGERWALQVNVEGLREEGGKFFIRYRPRYYQQRGALREIDEKVFSSVFFPERPVGRGSGPQSDWILYVQVTSIGFDPMTVEYRHVNPEGRFISPPKRVTLHLFRASFRRDTSRHDARPSGIDGGESGRGPGRRVQPRVVRGGSHVLEVAIESVRTENGTRHVRYAACRETVIEAVASMDEGLFRKTFEPVDGAVNDLAVGDRWFMLVEVTDIDEDESTVWYRRRFTDGSHQGEIKRMSDHVFLATFEPAGPGTGFGDLRPGFGTSSNARKHPAGQNRTGSIPARE